MKKSIPLIILLLLMTLHAEIPASTPFPKPSGSVNDFASVIPEPYLKKMNDLSEEVLAKTGVSLVVATVETIGDNAVETYANELYRDWGIGKKGEDKGVLILLALKERKIKIETGYGVEGILPDGLVGQILDESVLPYLKNGRYGEGLYNGLVSVALVIAKDAGVQLTGDYRPVRQVRRRQTGISPFLLFLIVLFLLFGSRAIWPGLFLAGMAGRGRSPGGFGGGYDRGGFGGFGGGFGGFGGGMSGGGGASRGF